MSVKLLSEHHLEFFALTGTSESTLVKMPHYWKSHVTAYIYIYMSKNIICMLHIISLCAQISQNVKYWYEKCDVLVPTFHAL